MREDQDHWSWKLKRKQVDEPRRSYTTESMEADRTKHGKACRELYGMLAGYIGSEAATIVRSMMGLKEFETWGDRSRTSAQMSNVQRECVYPKDMNHVKFVITIGLIQISGGH